VVPESAARQAAGLFSGGRKIGWITFTSSSTVQNFVQVAGTEALGGVNVASIGPVTTATAAKLGLTVTVEASVYTADGLVEAILRYTNLI
jgi:uroporphyrinogen III methyltransferase/synthase